MATKVRIVHPQQATQHLSYCSNIHPGESWQQTLVNMQDNLPGIRKAISPEQDLGIGLRLSAQAASDLANADAMAEFHDFSGQQPFLFIYRQWLSLWAVSRHDGKGVSVPARLDGY